MRMNRAKNRYWMIVAAGCGLIGTCLGLGINISGLFFSAIADEFQTGMAEVSASLTIYNLVHAFVGMSAPFFLKRFRLKKMLAAGTVLQFISTFLLSKANGLPALWLLNALRGTAAGMIGTVTVTMIINYWFNQNNALMTSIAMCFSGLAGALLSPLISGIIAGSGWRVAYQVTALLVLVFNLPAILLPITLKPEEAGMKPYGEKQKNVIAEPSEKGTKISAGLFALVILFGITSSAVTAFPPHFAGLAESYQLATAGALMVSAGMITNSFGKILIGRLIDHYNLKFSIRLFTAGVLLGAFGLLLGRNDIVLILSSALYGLAYGISMVALVSLTRELFGTAQYSRVYPKAALASTLSNAIFTTVAGGVYDRYSSYTPMITFLIILIVATLLLAEAAYRIHNLTVPKI